MQPPDARTRAASGGAGIQVAMVLAAGLGTRLRPLTDERPKPLVPVGDRPLLSLIVSELARAGVQRVVVNTHHGAEAFDAELLQALALPTVCVHEPSILGTAGGVRNAAPWLGDGDVVVWNGDILADVDVAGLVAAHRAHRPLATLAVAPDRGGPGTVGLAASGAVARLRNERHGAEARSADFVGVAVLSAELRRALPAEGCLVGDALLPALRQGQPIHAAPVVHRWSDIGTLAEYLRANVTWLSDQGIERWVAPGAAVGDAVELRHAVVGAGATVRGAGALHRCVVWPGATATAPLANAVVTLCRVVGCPPQGAAAEG